MVRFGSSCVYFLTPNLCQKRSSQAWDPNFPGRACPHAGVQIPTPPCRGPCRPPVSRPSGHASHAILHSGYLYLSLISWITSNLMATALPHQTHSPGLATFSPPKQPPLLVPVGPTCLLDPPALCTSGQEWTSYPANGSSCSPLQ